MAVGRGTLVAIESDRWVVVGGDGRCAELPAGPDVALDELAGQVASTMKEMDRAGPVCLGLSSQRLLVARVDARSLPRRQRASALRYRLEEQLPIDAEQLTMAFEPVDANTMLGVAVETAPAAAIVDALAAAGVETAGICGISLLALWTILQGEGDVPDSILLSRDGHVDVFRVAGGRPARWLTAAADSLEGVAGAVQIDRLHDPIEGRTPTAAAFGIEPAVAQCLDALAGIKVDRRDDPSVLAAAAEAAGRRLAGQPAGWIDLRTGPLAMPAPWGRFRRLWWAAAILALAMLGSLAGMCLWRAGRYEAVAAERQARQAALYRGLYPAQPVPQGVADRLRSEAKRLAGLRGGGTGAPHTAAMLDELADLTAGLPATVRLRITELRLGPEGFLLEGQTTTHGDAEMIAEGLRQKGFAAEPPRTEKLVKGGVAFNLAGPARQDAGQHVAEGRP